MQKHRKYPDYIINGNNVGYNWPVKPLGPVLIKVEERGFRFGFVISAIFTSFLWALFTGMFK